MAQFTVTVPEEAVNAISMLNDPRVLAVVATLVVAAILTSIVVEIIKRRYTAKQQEKLAKKYIALLLASLSSLFTFLGSALILAQENASVLSNLPFVGQHFMSVVGIAYVLYSLKFNKFYMIASNYLGKWSKKTDKQEQVPAVASPVQVQPDANQFV